MKLKCHKCQKEYDGKERDKVRLAPLSKGPKVVCRKCFPEFWGGITATTNPIEKKLRKEIGE